MGNRRTRIAGLQVSRPWAHDGVRNTHHIGVAAYLRLAPVRNPGRLDTEVPDMTATMYLEVTGPCRQGWDDASGP